MQITRPKSAIGGLAPVRRQVVLPPAQRLAGESPRIITIAQATAEHPRHSEPSFVELSDGSLLLAWQEFIKSDRAGNDHAPNRIAAALSRDGGLSWTDHRVLVDTQAPDVNVYSPSFLRLPSGEILLFFLRYDALEEGKPLASSYYVRRSQDEGRTFGDESVVWDHKPHSCASSVVKYLSSGRIMVPASVQIGKVWTESDHDRLGSLYSDDDGRTWQACARWVDLPLRGASEGHVEELRDGRLLMVMRTQLGAVFGSISSDGGVTWSKPQTTGLRAPESCPEIGRIPRTGDLLMVWNNSDYDMNFGSHFGKRSPLTIAVSKDDGATWTGVKNIVEDPRRCYTNPVLAFTRDNKVILSYFELPYTENWLMDTRRVDLRAAIFNVDWIYS